MSTGMLRPPAPPCRVPMASWLVVATALLGAATSWMGLQAWAASTRFEAGVVFAPDACDLSPGIALELGGALTRADCATVERLARREISTAFDGLRLDVTADRLAFWTVHVAAYVPASTRTLGASGASVALGPLGGRGVVGLTLLAGQALRHAPPGATRDDIVAAIGRGVGRAVVHEFAHQIAGGAIDGGDVETYEYGSSDRAAQYYGTLHWGEAGARVRSRVGR